MQANNHGYFITGTDTDVGKTVAAAWSMLHLDANYWKPLQSGEPKDITRVKELTELSEDRFFPSAYEFSQPLSPHEAARRDNVKIEMDKLRLPESARPLVVEGAGGLMVPINDDELVIDLAANLGLPVILVCRSGLGTINHTLLSLEALRARKMPVKGIIINGPKTPHNREALEEYGHVPVIAEIDDLKTVDKISLSAIPPEVIL